MASEDSGARVERVEKYHWKQGNTHYRLSDIPTSPCHKCGAEISDDEYCYFREERSDDGSDLDHVCWDCGNEVTDFAN